ncbi:MAG: hypothetical protein FOGNACKC_01597 [Anaerolineae bacterium]|nr:hypothetical protein [Anaerolineae bacterium]
MYCAIKDGACLHLTDIIAFDGEGIVTRPSAVVDDENIIHLLSRREDIYYSVAPADQAYDPKAWSKKIVISSGHGPANYSDIKFDEQGVLHVVWNEAVPDNGLDPTPETGTDTALQTSIDVCPSCADIFHRRSLDKGKTWSDLIDITNSEMGAEKPQIVTDKKNTFVFWEEGADFYSPTKSGEPRWVGVVKSGDGGVEWSPTTMLVFPNDAPQRMGAGVDKNNNLVVVWGLVKSDEVYYQISTDEGESWSIPKAIPGIAARALLYSSNDDDLDTYNITADGAGNLHLVLVGRPNNGYIEGTNSILHLEWNGKTWSEPEVIFTSSEMPEWPKIAVANGNELHVVWFVYHYDTKERERYQIWYANKKLITVPTATPRPLPSPSPTPQIIGTPAVTPTLVPTILPPEIANIPVSNPGVIYTETDELITVAISVIPAVLIIGLVVFGYRRFRGNR